MLGRATDASIGRCSRANPISERAVCLQYYYSKHVSVRLVACFCLLMPSPSGEIIVVGGPIRF